MTAQLFLSGSSERLIVGAGSVVGAGGRNREVVRVDKRRGRARVGHVRPVEAS